MQTIASYGVSSVVFVFGMTSLGCILISDLVVANLLMYSLPGRAGQFDSIMVIPRYVDSPILIPNFILLYDFIVIANNRSNNN